MYVPTVHPGLRSSKMRVGVVMAEVGPNVQKMIDFSSGTQSAPCTGLVGGAGRILGLCSDAARTLP